MQVPTNDGYGRSSRYTISYLMLVTWGVCIAMTPIGRWGLSGVMASAGLLVVTLLAIQQKYRAATVCLVLLGLLSLLPAAINELHSAPAHMRCTNDMKQVALAIMTYESAHGHFPPPFTTDDEGRRLHSWRVLILPYLEQQALYEQFDLNQPWDAPVNLKLANQMPTVFRCPIAATDSHVVTTPYVAVIGSETVWAPNGRRVYRDIEDGVDNTLMILKSTAQSTHWMNPNDPTFDEVVPIRTDGTTRFLSSGHSRARSCANGAFCDGSVRKLPEALDWRALRQLLTVAGGENVTATKVE